MNETPRPVERLAEREVYRNKFISVFDDEVQFASGGLGTYLRIVESGGARGVVALPIAGDLIGLVRTYRYALGAFEWSLPRGFAHSEDSSLSILRELDEELGAQPTKIERLGEVAPNSGLLASVVDVFVAHYDTTVDSPTDTDEISAVRWVRTTEMLDEVGTGQIVDGFTLSALCLAMTTGLLVPSR
jgi:ADP-ribose pyrophosphatase